MFAEGESELRDLIVQNLETCGFLSKIKAELRAGVFLALTEEDNLQKKIPLFHEKLNDFIDTSDGKLALSIVREFLEYFELSFTLSVFDPEIATSSPCTNRTDLCKMLDLDEAELTGPVLSTLLKQQSGAVSHKGHSISFNQLDRNGDDLSKKSPMNFLQEKFPLKDTIENKTTASATKSGQFDITSVSSDKTTLGKDRDKNEQESFFEDQSSALDPFFDAPLPSEKSSFLSSISSNKTNNQDKLSHSFLHYEKTGLSSLRDLPSLTKKADLFSKEPSSIVKQDSNLIDSSDVLRNSFKNEDENKKDVDPESNEESSDRQLNSEESIGEEIEEDFSAGIDDLLNSSLSLGDDATSDQTISQTSVVEGVDHIEPCHSMN